MKQFEEFLVMKGGVNEEKINDIYHQIKKILAYSIKCAELKLDKKVG